MAAILCQNKLTCCNPDEAGENFSSAAPDVDRFLSGIGYRFRPPLGVTFGALSCVGWCWSTVSQAEADLCNLTAQQLCTEDAGDGDPPGVPGGGGGGGNGPWRGPDGEPVALFSNTTQSCQSMCPDSTLFTSTIQAGAVFALTQAEANYNARGLACQQAALYRFCFVDSSPLPPGCAGEFYSHTLTLLGGVGPFTFSIAGGSLPNGLTLSPAGVISGVIDPTAFGDFVITVQVQDNAGNIKQKNLLIGACGATASSTLPAYTAGQPYSQFVGNTSSVGCRS